MRGGGVISVTTIDKRKGRWDIRSFSRFWYSAGWELVCN